MIWSLFHNYSQQAGDIWLQIIVPIVAVFTIISFIMIGIKLLVKKLVINKIVDKRIKKRAAKLNKKVANDKQDNFEKTKLPWIYKKKDKKK